MPWNDNVSDVHTFSTEITVKNIYAKPIEEGGKSIVYNIHYRLVGTDNDGSGNTYTLEDEMICFNPSQINTSNESFIDIDEVTNEIAEDWINSFYESNDNINYAFTNLLYGAPNPTGTE